MGLLSWWRRREQFDALKLLAEDIRERHRALSEAEAKRAEVEIRKIELEAQYAEHLAKARIAEKDAQAERRAKLRQWGKEGQARYREKLRNPDPIPCKVCANQGDPTLTPPEIEWHHAGHPENFQPRWEM